MKPDNNLRKSGVFKIGDFELVAKMSPNLFLKVNSGDDYKSILLRYYIYGLNSLKEVRIQKLRSAFTWVGFLRDSRRMRRGCAGALRPI